MHGSSLAVRELFNFISDIRLKRAECTSPDRPFDAHESRLLVVGSSLCVVCCKCGFSHTLPLRSLAFLLGVRRAHSSFDDGQTVET